MALTLLSFAFNGDWHVERYKSRKQEQRFNKGKTSFKAKQRRQSLHVRNPLTGRGEWKVLAA